MWTHVYYATAHLVTAYRPPDARMQLDLTEEQRLLRDTCRDFADKELRPKAKRWDREHRTTLALCSRCATYAETATLLNRLTEDWAAPVTCS